MKESSNKKKGILVGVIVALVLVVAVGVTFAIWNYSRVGDNQLLVTGDIYMKFKEDNTLTIEDALPREEYIPGKYFEFTVEGVNDYSKDIHYQILLSEGEAPTGDENKDRTERIRPDLLLFKLVEVEDGEETIIFDRMSYPELDNTSVWVDTIKANTNTKTTKTYRLYMWISPLTKIGVGDNLDYEMDIWNNNVYGSVKVTVQGDFNEKNESNCFTLGVATATYNDQRTDEQVNACVEWLNQNLMPEESAPLEDGESYKGFCEGTGTVFGETFQNTLDSGTFTNFIQELSEIGIVKDVKITSLDKYDGTNLDYNIACKKDVVIPSVIDKVKVTEINENAFWNKLLTSVNIPEGVTTIGESAFQSNQLIKVNIPNSVTTIGRQAFASNNLISLNISEGVQSIEELAFAGNNLTKVIIPNSVTTIGEEAFFANKLEEVSIGNGIKEIGAEAFSKLAGSTVKPENNNENLKSITIDKTCNEIKNIPNYAWLTPDNQSPSRQGTTIYGSSGEVCDAY